MTCAGCLGEATYWAIEGLDGYHCVRMEDFGTWEWKWTNSAAAPRQLNAISFGYNEPPSRSLCLFWRGAIFH